MLIQGNDSLTRFMTVTCGLTRTDYLENGISSFPNTHTSIGKLPNQPNLNRLPRGLPLLSSISRKLLTQL